MSDDASTLSSVSTSSLSTTSVSSHSSDSGSLARSEADVVVLPDVPSESDEWELAPDGEDETGEVEVAPRMLRAGHCNVPLSEACDEGTLP